MAPTITEIVGISGYLLLINIAGSNVQAQIPPTCDVTQDTCPEELQFNNVCNSERGTNDCPGADCFDCDFCRLFIYDCEACTSNGCMWCPGDATCFGNNYNLSPFGYVASCLITDDYVFDADQCGDATNPFNDPLYSGEQWAYTLINVESVWASGVMGTGSRIRINDAGVDSTHPEFAGRFDLDSSCDLYSPQNNTETRGTAIASIIAGAANNNECAVGIAPLASISSCNVVNDDTYVYLDDNLTAYDISQNAIPFDACPYVDETGRRMQATEPSCLFSVVDPRLDSPCDVCDFSQDVKTEFCKYTIIDHCYFYYREDQACLEFLDLFIEGGRCHYNALSEDTQQKLLNGIQNGRDQKGIIYVYGSGDGYFVGADTNFEGFLNTRFTITVGGVNRDGRHASYSTPGAALFVAAPGGGVDSLSNHMTATNGGGCEGGRVGTPFASAVVSGVVALMLEVNPNLGWRDVQGILATTSTLVIDSDDSTRITNNAGITHSNYYGFGIVNADAAVHAAMSWVNYGDEAMLLGDSGPIQTTIPESGALESEVSISMDNSAEMDFIAESVGVYLTLKHTSRGDLEIILTSPHGTESVLHPGRRPEATQVEQNEQWKFLTVRSWGESAIGTWTLRIADSSPGDLDSCLDIPGWGVNFNGDDGWNCYWVDQLMCFNGEHEDQWFGNVFTAEEFYVTKNETSGLTADDACCSCGGGLASSAFSDELVSWHLVVYGHEIEQPDPTPAPTPATFELASLEGAESLGSLEADQQDSLVSEQPGPLETALVDAESTNEPRCRDYNDNVSCNETKNCFWCVANESCERDTEDALEACPKAQLKLSSAKKKLKGTQKDKKGADAHTNKGKKGADAQTAKKKTKKTTRRFLMEKEEAKEMSLWP